MQIHHPIRVGAFTLIELLTVISIMAILSAVAFPAVNGAMVRGQMVSAMANARSIAAGLRTFASDNAGLFPIVENTYEEEITSSNDAFRSLIPEYIDDERIFANARSAWGREADNRIEEPQDMLEPGENHYAFVSGLTDTSRSSWPLVVDGTDGTGNYGSQQGVKGGCWEGRKAIVATVGGSAMMARLKGSGDEKYLPREGYDDENALDVAYMGEHVELLEPAGD